MAERLNTETGRGAALAEVEVNHTVGSAEGIGTAERDNMGEVVGTEEGDNMGEGVGTAEGDNMGVGTAEGDNMGEWVGTEEGDNMGEEVGIEEGDDREGRSEGNYEDGLRVATHSQEGVFVGGEVEVGDNGGVSEPQEASRGHSQI